MDCPPSETTYVFGDTQYFVFVIHRYREVLEQIWIVNSLLLVTALTKVMKISETMSCNCLNCEKDITKYLAFF